MADRGNTRNAGGGAALELATQDIARARARMALRAELAWGVVSLPAHRTPALQEEERAAPVAPSAKAPTAGPAAGAEPDFDAPAGPRQERLKLLLGLDDAQVRGCTLCPLCQTRRQTEFGEGDPEAVLMFIGEGPGQTEDETGRPFVGRAGELLNKMIAGMGLSREQVYIANVVKCRPPGNRVPTPLEVQTCSPYLHKQIEWVRPRAIVTLGLPATRHLLRSSLPMGRLRGSWGQWRGIPVMPTYHPAYLLRSYTDENRRTVWGDLQQVMARLGLRRSEAKIVKSARS